MHQTGAIRWVRRLMKGEGTRLLCLALAVVFAADLSFAARSQELTSTKQIHELSADEASHERQVHVQGRVLVLSGGKNSLSLSNGTASANLVELETRGRAFSLTGRPALLARYERGRSNASHSLAVLGRLTADNLEQHWRLISLQQGADEAITLASRIVAIRKIGPYPARGDVMSDTVEFLDSSIRDPGGEVVWGELPVVEGDHFHMVQLMQNLIGNGLTYRGQTPPQIQVGAEQKDYGEWEVSVRDNGLGIDPSHHERIFEIFKRLQHQKEYPGTGIGLAICRRVVERHGGKIWVESKVGGGSTFHFTISGREDRTIEQPI